MIFNANNNGTVELQEVTGVYFQSNNFHVIAAEIKSAEQAVRRMLGKALFDRAEKHYRSAGYVSTADDVDTQLVKAVQTPVALQAMYNYFQMMLSHEDSGRKLKLDTNNEQIPWAWQVERDDQALLDKYHRALDELYLFLEENNVPEWKESQAYNDRMTCFVQSLADFEKVFPLEGSFRMFYIIVPFMQEVQERIIRPVVGDEAFEKMKKGNVSADDLCEQFEAARLCIPLYAVITVVNRMSIKVLPSMIVRRFSASFQGGKGGSIEAQAQRHLLDTLTQEAIAAKTELQKAVTKRRQPVQESDLIPPNNPHKKFCST